jgi:cytochrome c-type biogenesis protein CcmH/NrfG
MNEDLNQQILTEIRRLRRSNNIGMALAAIALVAAGIYFPLRMRSLRPPATTQTQTDSWASVSRAIDHFDYETASAIAQRLVQRYPNDYYGYVYLGNIALATGHLQDAERHYQRACEILPSDQNERMLRAIKQRIQNDASTSATHEAKPK